MAILDPVFADRAGQTPQDVERMRRLAKQLMEGAPKEVKHPLQGLNLLLANAMSGYQDKQASDADKAGEASANQNLADMLMGGVFPSAPRGAESSSDTRTMGPTAKADNPNLPSRLDFARASPGAGSGSLPGSFIAAVDHTEGGGDYDTLFGHSQRDGRAFAGTRISEMPISEALAFADPRGAYAQSVKGQIGRVATPMGRHQIVGTTLRNAVQEMGIDPSTPFNKDTQDAIAAHLARKRIAGSDTMDGKIAGLRAEWEGFKNVPHSQMVQIVTDLENGGTGAAPAAAAAQARATGGTMPQAPVQVASLDPSAGMSQAAPPVPQEYAAAGLSPEQWQRMNAPQGAVPPASQGPMSDIAAQQPAAPAPPMPAQLASAQPMGGQPMPMMPPQGGGGQQQLAQMLQQGSPQPQAGPPPQQVAQALMQGGPTPEEEILGPAVNNQNASPMDDQNRRIIAGLLSDPRTAPMGQQLAAQMLQQQMKPADPNAALDAEYKRAQIDNLRKKGDGTDETFFGNPLFIRDKDNNVVPAQMGNKGTLRPLPLGEGNSLAPPTKTVNTDTEQIVMDNFGSIISRIPIQNREAARETAIGTTEGKVAAEQAAAAPGDLQAAQNALDLLESIRSDPNRERGTGKSSILNAMPGTGGFDFNQKVEQAKSGAFLSAIQQMRGMGALSNTEGTAATAAITRMNTSMSEEGFMEALDDYEKIVQQALDRAQSKIPGAAATPNAPAAEQPRRLKFNPATGELK